MSQSRPLILLALAALLPLILLSALLGAAWLHQKQTDMERAALDQVRHAATAIERELEEQVETLLVLAQSPVFDAPLSDRPQDAAAVADLLERVRRQVGIWQILSVSDPQGQRLVDVPRPIAGRAGPVIDMESHARAVAGKTPAVGGIRRGPQGRAAFAIRVPVLRDGTVVSVLSAVVSPDTINRLLRDNVPEGWRGSVADSEGRLAARTFGDPSLIAQPASANVQAARARGGEGLFEGASVDGELLAGGFRMLPGWNWSVQVTMPIAEYYAPLRTAQWILAIGVLASLALAGGFLVLLVREAEARRRVEAAQESGRRMEALGRMTGGVAHDFNNLLMIAQSGAEAIKRRAGDPERVAAYADSIITAVQRGAALTRQLLAFARRSPQAPRLFRLQERAADLLPLLERSARADIATSLTVPDDLWPVFADPDALEVALVNLVVNARDAMPGGGRLAVGAANVVLTGRRGDPAGLSGEHVAIGVCDSGTGIAPEDLDRIFEPFYTTKPVDRGTGLGLSQVLGFAKQSGGAVSVESRVGAGTTVTLYLPRASGKPDGAGDQGTGTVAVEPGGGADGVAGIAVLLVEDDPEVADGVTAILADAGCNVVHAASGAAALERFEQAGPFDAVLSDIMLAGGPSGLDLVPLFRKRCPGLPMVLMTGYRQTPAGGLPEGVSILDKPVARADLIGALRMAVTASRAVAAARS
ncbi:hybrid sensor histidine kinase/response regulator [Azospirillum picis]|uniref:histidine kinase n=1 Tax=Azospirillum picis TaxID=488438 RepID=A0ABU0MMU0_9PROT|nr:ATP-binding protein [Azospirillum picis]MBP2300798.1 signal transduction histidine kinase/CheY-like chemotaxis protein [Azospirillum picis]MDQ0534767.1 signal transduction histidine kinase/CheY-like chemotaxis protein [Azospirillum picis]